LEVNKKAMNIIDEKKVNNEVELLTVGSFIKKVRFVVKSYQRGYKWTGRQVQELLQDISEFKIAGSDYYCLQPIVVREDNGLWELIDGQQRLTTIFIILSYLRTDNFHISYQTRTSSENFLSSFVGENKLEEYDSWQDFLEINSSSDNIDNYHFFQAFQEVTNWFDKNQTIDKDLFLKKLIDHTKVIWYNIKDKNTNAITVFSRLNSGKIPLTNAELIKALFLKKTHNGERSDFQELRQTEIAHEWDRIENHLQNDEFWYFLNKDPYKTELPTRIDFIFNILVKPPISNRVDQSYTYQYYSGPDIGINNEWEKVKRCFMTLQEWFEDIELYHLIGYVVTSDFSNIRMLYLQSNCSKSAFKNHLKNIIKTELNITEESLSELQYGVNNDKITQILLLFNIQSILNSHSNIRFPFDKYKVKDSFQKVVWSLEHIHAQNSKKLDALPEMISWYHEVMSLLQTIQPSDEQRNIYKTLIDNLEGWWRLDAKTNEEGLKILSDLQNQVAAFIGDTGEEEEMHGIENLALLDRNSNSSLNNSLFPVKRELIIKKDKAGQFIPFTTKNVFLKYYSDNILQMNIWSKNDRQKYVKAIVESLKDEYFHATA
jgi:hypothetical protein